MANLDTPKGFEVYGVCRRANRYVAGAACYPGDFVVLSSDGKVDPATAGSDVLGLAISYASADGDAILVADHPDQLFVGQCASSAIDTQSDIGNLADILATAANTIYKTSRQEIDTTTLYTSISAQVQILAVEPNAANGELGADVKVVVRVNEHVFGNRQSAGI